MENRMKKAVLGGAILGVFCVIGAYIRSGMTASTGFVFSLWYNRVLLGVIVGAPWNKIEKNNRIVRGAILGLLVSFAFYSSTGFNDHISFIAGIIYGIMLEFWLMKFEG